MNHRDLIYIHMVENGAAQEPDRELYELLDDGKGRGPQIVRWDRSLGAKPTQAQADALDQSAVDAWWESRAKERDADADQWSAEQRVLARIAFNQENRIRKLELKQPIRWEDFKARIKQEL